METCPSSLNLELPDLYQNELCFYKSAANRNFGNILFYCRMCPSINHWYVQQGCGRVVRVPFICIQLISRDKFSWTNIEASACNAREMLQSKQLWPSPSHGSCAFLRWVQCWRTTLFTNIGLTEQGELHDMAFVSCQLASRLWGNAI